jgi:hypothetical protein
MLMRDFGSTVLCRTPPYSLLDELDVLVEASPEIYGNHQRAHGNPKSS